jgi:hypothetical protein
MLGFKSSRKGEQVSKTNIEPFGRWRLPDRQIILYRRFPGTNETVGQLFQFVWRLCWKINVACMSLSPFDSFQSRFVTCLLTFPWNKNMAWMNQGLTTGGDKRFFSPLQNMSTTLGPTLTPIQCKLGVKWACVNLNMHFQLVTKWGMVELHLCSP